MRCPDCRHRIAARRWLPLPGTLLCYQCEALLERGGPASAFEVIATWVVMMLPFGALFSIGGVGGLIVAIALGGLIYPMQPWQGFRYRLAINQPKALPVARAVGRDGKVESEKAPRD